MVKSKYFIFLTTILSITGFTACLIIINKDIASINPRLLKGGYDTKSSCRAHLNNGDVVVMPSGFQIGWGNPDSLLLYPRELGIKYDLTRKMSQTAEVVVLNDIAFIETFKNQADPAVFLTGIPGATATVAFAAVAIFGSCPTYYSFDGQEYILEAEGFSYSIAPKLEVQDLDRLHNLQEVENEVFIQIRNEALETHYIDQLELVSVEHDTNYKAFTSVRNNLNPFVDKEVLLTGTEIKLKSTTSRLGENILPLIEKKDDQWYRTPISIIEKLTSDPNEKDWLDITLNVPEDQKAIYLMMNLRNSLINSVFFYDILLDEQNFSAIDWMSTELDQYRNVYRFYKWYTQFFGMSVEIMENGIYREVQSFGDLGPISWSERAMKIPLNKGGEIQLRLKFMPDNWQIDWIGVSLEGIEKAKAVKHQLTLSEIQDYKTPHFENTLLEEDDDNFFIQYPGNAINLKASSGVPDKGNTYSWFIRSKGYYTEWIRKDWLLADNKSELMNPVEYSDSLITRLADQWLTKKDEFERLFFETIIPLENKAL